MLAGSVSITPRPRPPARSRRTSANIKSSPPPPYRPSLPDDSLIQSEKVSADSLRGDWNRLSFPTRSDTWNERSREELSDLLHKADELIKDREMELNATTAVCKSLYENNLELKSRHKALLARLPHSPASSSPAASSSSPSPISPDSQLPQSPHYYSGDDSHSASNISLRDSRPRPHYRRVSVSPADLALLSDQNAELLAKLEKLETESIQADQAGRRKLRSLEKEIQGLRDELEKTRARSDELEKKARVVSETVQKDEEVERRKREREERFRALRGKADPEMEEAEVRDFAPGGALSTQGNSLGLGHPPKARFTPRRRHISEAFVRPKLHELSPFDNRQRRLSFQSGLLRSASEPQESLFFSSFSPPVTLTHEYALVSQLLQKIQELEETNAQITEQQARTVAQLQSVQEDATSLRLAYESLGDGEGVEWIADDEESSSNLGENEADETIRFTSLCRSTSPDTSSLEFDGGIDVDMQSSLRQEVLPDHVPVSAHAKVRRSVVGLFDIPQGDITSPSSPVSESTPSVLEMMIPGLPPVPFVPQPSNTSTSPSPSQSPILSPSLTGALSPVEDPFRHPTLDSELGAAFDGIWDGRNDSPANVHFRTPSIVSLTSIIPDAGDVSASSSISGPQSEPYIQQTVSGLQPGPFHGGQYRSLSSLPDPKPETPAERKRRKSQTIRMRAVHWNEGRFGGTLLGSEKRHSVDISRPSTPVPERLANAFEAIVDTMSRSKGETNLSYDVRDDKSRSTDGSMVVIRSGRTIVTTRPSPPPAPRQRGIVAFVLEIWLWLQFAIIVIVFLWAMAKRGPKSVLEEASRRKRA